MIVFISENKKAKFSIHAGKAVPSPGDNDSIISVQATINQKFNSLTEAQSFIKNNPQDFKIANEDVKIYLQPVKTSSMGFWLNEIISLNK